MSKNRDGHFQCQEKNCKKGDKVHQHWLPGFLSLSLSFSHPLLSPPSLSLKPYLVCHLSFSMLPIYALKSSLSFSLSLFLSLSLFVFYFSILLSFILDWLEQMGVSNAYGFLSQTAWCCVSNFVYYYYCYHYNYLFYFYYHYGFGYYNYTIHLIIVCIALLGWRAAMKPWLIGKRNTQI